MLRFAYSEQLAEIMVRDDVAGNVPFSKYVDNICVVV